VLEALPFRDLSRLCKAAGLRTPKRKLEQLGLVRAWHNLLPGSGESLGEGFSHSGGSGAGSEGGRVGSIGEEIEEEELAGGEEEEESMLAFHGLAVGAGGAEHQWPPSPSPAVRSSGHVAVPLSSSSMASAVSGGTSKKRKELEDDSDLYSEPDDPSTMIEIKQIHQEKRAKKWFPDQTLKTSRNQHEYDFLQDTGHLAMEADQRQFACVTTALQGVLHAIETRAHMVVVGDEEGWDMVAHLEQGDGSLFDHHKDRLYEARKKAKKGKHKLVGASGKQPFFRQGPRLARSSQASQRPQLTAGVGLSGSVSAYQKDRRPQAAGSCFVCSRVHFVRACPWRFMTGAVAQS
jgi:hypothetical protein